MDHIEDRKLPNDEASTVERLRLTLSGRNIGVAITASVAAGLFVPGCLLSMRQAIGIEVIPIMSRSAERFLSPYLVHMITGRRPLGLFHSDSNVLIPHINVGKSIDALVVMPATANIIGKIANGIADDIISTTVLACECPVVLAPNMNATMWNKPSVQRNIARLIKDGYSIIQPVYGIEIATLTVSFGAMPNIVEILNYLCAVIKKQNSYQTAGTQQSE